MIKALFDIWINTLIKKPNNIQVENNVNFFFYWRWINRNIEPLSERMGRERGGNGKGEEEKGEILNLFLRITEARSDLLVIELVIRHRSVGQVWGTFDGEDHWIKLLSLLLGHEWGIQLQLYKHVLYPRDRRLQPIGDRLHTYKSKKDFNGFVN